jgi:hypothetical protein
MKKADLEQLLATRIRAAVEAAAVECLQQINRSGHHFVASNQGMLRWVDADRDQVLEITCAFGVGIQPRSTAERVPDPVTTAFCALAESGTDRVATTLNLVDGDIANGGFSQLFDNKSVAFVREAIGYLDDIGKALALVEESATVIEDYNQLQKTLSRFDARYERLNINLPELHARWRDRTMGNRSHPG